MSCDFTPAPDITVSGAQVTLEVYVRNLGGQLKLFWDDGCTRPVTRAELNVPKEKLTGLYFHISSHSDTDTCFPDGTGGDPCPVTWRHNGSKPSTVTYQKIKADKSAFSMSDLWSHSIYESHEFDINVKLPSGDPGSVAIVEGVDPTIVERGEEPSGHGH